MLTNRLDTIRREYAPARLARLGFTHTFEANADFIRSDAILEHYVEDARRFLDATITAEARAAIRDRPLVFEGARVCCSIRIAVAFRTLPAPTPGCATYSPWPTNWVWSGWT